MRFEAMGTFVSRGLRPLVWQHPRSITVGLISHKLDLLGLSMRDDPEIDTNQGGLHDHLTL